MTLLIYETSQSQVRQANTCAWLITDTTSNADIQAVGIPTHSRYEKQLSSLDVVQLEQAMQAHAKQTMTIKTDSEARH